MQASSCDDQVDNKTIPEQGKHSDNNQTDSEPNWKSQRAWRAHKSCWSRSIARSVGDITCDHISRGYNRCECAWYITNIYSIISGYSRVWYWSVVHFLCFFKKLWCMFRQIVPKGLLFCYVANYTFQIELPRYSSSFSTPRKHFRLCTSRSWLQLAPIVHL